MCLEQIFKSQPAFRKQECNAEKTTQTSRSPQQSLPLLKLYLESYPERPQIYRRKTLQTIIIVLTEEKTGQIFFADT